MSLDLGALTAKIGLDDDEFSKGLVGVLDKFKESGSKLTKLAAGVGASAAVALGAALAGAMEQQNVGARVAAQLGGGADQAAMYGKLAGKIYAQNFGDSLDQVGEALKSVEQANIVPEDAGADALQATTEKALTFTNVFGQDMPAVLNAVQQLLRTGMAQSADQAFDVLTRGEQEGVDKADDLLDTFNEYPTQFRKLGLNAQTAMGLLSQGLKGGARDSDIVADALKEFSIRAVDGSTTTAAGFKLLGLSGKQMSEDIGKGGDTATAALQKTLDKLRGIKDPVQQSQAAVDLFGTQAEDLGKALYSLDPKTAVNALGQVDGATSKAGKTMSDTASGNIESFKRQLQVGFVQVLGGQVLPPVQQLTHWLADNLGPAVQDVAHWMGQNKDVVEPLAIALGTMVGVILAVAAAVKAWEIVQAILNIELAGNPIGLIALAIAGLVALIVLIAQHTDFFAHLWDTAWGGIKGAALAVWNWIKGNWPLLLTILTGPIGAAVAWVIQHWGQVTSFFSSAKNKLASIGSGMWSWIKTGFRDAIDFVIRGWNSLRFGIPRIDTHIPGIGVVGGGSFGVPRIPLLADGGIVPATPGGRLVGVGEGGQDEAVIPLSKLAGMFGGGTFRLETTGTTGDRILETLLALLRDHIRIRYRKDVQLALGG